MKMKNILVFLLFSAPVISFAQQLSIQEQRDFNEAALKTILSYESNSYLQTSTERNRFKNLFEKADMYIYNDLLGLDWSNEITVEKYVSTLSKQASDTQFTLKNISKSDPYQRNNDWYIDITFDKSTIYSNQCGVIFSSEEYYKADHRIKAVLKWNPSTGTALITALTGKINTKAPQIPFSYAIFERTSDYDDILYCNGKHLKFNKYGQTFIDDNSKFALDDDEIRLTVNKTDCNVYTISYSPMKYRIRPYYNFSLGNCYTLSAKNGQKYEGSSSWDIGIDFGRVIFTTPKTKGALFTGVGYSKSVLDLSIDHIGYSYQAGSDADVDGEDYIRFYDINDIKGRVNIHDLVVPFYFDIETKLGKYASLYLDFGVKVYTRLKTNDTHMTANYSTKGYYEQYCITLDETSGINGFTNGSTFESDNMWTSTFKNKMFSLDGMGQGGFRFRLSQTVFLDAGLSYQKSIIKPYKEDQSNTPNFMDSPMLYYSVERGEHGRGITDGIVESGRKSFKLQFGLTFKL